MSIEGDGPDLMQLLQRVRDVAPKLTEIRIVTAPSGPPLPPSPGGGSGSGENGGRSATRTLREFARSLGPTNSAERIIAIAAYVERQEGRDSFRPKEMGDWFTICGFQKPSEMSVALFDAKWKYGYLDS